MRARARPRCTVSTPDFWPVAITWNTSDNGTFLRLPSIILGSPLADLAEQWGRVRWQAQAEVEVGGLGRHAAPCRALQQASLHQRRLVHLFPRRPVLPDGGSERVSTDRSAYELLDDNGQDGPVAAVQPGVVDPQRVERRPGAMQRDRVVASPLGVVADTPQQALGDP